MAKDKDQKLAKRLAQIILKAGTEGEAQLPAALDLVLQGKTNREKRFFLQAFQHVYQRELFKDTLTIESAETLDPEAIAEISRSFAAKHDRPLHVSNRVEPGLIGGVRVRLGDTVYDASVSGHLTALASRIQ